MNLATRKSFYLLFGAGGFVLASLNFTAGVVSVLLGGLESLDIVLVTIGGYVGLVSATLVWLNLPFIDVKKRLRYSIGIGIGCVAIILAFTVVWPWPPAFLSGDLLDIVIGSYLYFFPFLISVFLMFEIWITKDIYGRSRYVNILPIPSC